MVSREQCTHRGWDGADTSPPSLATQVGGVGEAKGQGVTDRLTMCYVSSAFNLQFHRGETEAQKAVGNCPKGHTIWLQSPCS